MGRVLGHYRLIEFAGAGGMGEVYRERDERLDREVSVRARGRLGAGKGMGCRRDAPRLVLESDPQPPGVRRADEAERLTGTAGEV
jgi:hypothetical protein